MQARRSAASAVERCVCTTHSLTASSAVARLHHGVQTTGDTDVYVDVHLPRKVLGPFRRWCNGEADKVGTSGLLDFVHHGGH
eukprot:11159874-Lingulodinium_polyedra.AAC.1